MSAANERVPRLSVIVPVRDRRTLLHDLLDALAKQTFSDFEVVVVDDGSSDGSGEEARTAAATLTIRVERTSGVGAVRARMIGVEKSAAAYLAFTDSDCVPDPEWLANGIAALEAGADIAVGATVPVRPPLILERTVYQDIDDGLCATCNVFYRREAYDAAGGFTDAGKQLGFRGGGRAKKLGFGEDTLLAWRIRRSGRFAFVPSAVVRHAVEQPGLWEIVWRTWVAGAFPSLIRAVPELRRTLLRGRLSLGPPRRIPVYALFVAAVLPWRLWLAPAAGTWWLLARLRSSWRSQGSPKRRLVAVPVEMTKDLVTAVALLVGSIRARTLVL